MSDHDPYAWRDDTFKYKGLTPIHIRATVYMATVYIDCETTGFHTALGNNPVHTVVDIAAVKVKANGDTEVFDSKCAVSKWHLEKANPVSLNVVLNGDKSVPDDVDALRRRMAREWDGAPDQASVMHKFLEFVQGCALVAHNADQDVLRFLPAPMFAAGLSWDMGRCFPWVCTEWLSRRMLPGLPGYKLENVCEALGIPVEGAHRAIGGAERCRQVVERLGNLVVKGLAAEAAESGGAQ